MRVATCSRKYRSWLTTTKARARSVSTSSSQRMPATSRWLVGSSISRMSGAAASSRAMASRLRQPPDSVSTAARPSVNSARPRACAARPGRSASSTPASAASTTCSTVRPAAKRARAAIGRRDARENLQQGGLAGAVGTDEAGLVSFEQPERQIVEERPGPVRHADRLAAEQERTTHPTLLLFLLRLLLFLPHAGAFRHGITSSRERSLRDYRYRCRRRESDPSR